jgi:hypothetical protein
LSTTVQPAAIAGATLAVTWYSGQFHGVISAQTRPVPADEDPVDLALERELAQHLDRHAHVLDPK